MPHPPYLLPAVRLTADDYAALNFRLWRARPATRRTHWVLCAAVVLLSLSIGLDLWPDGRPERPSTVIFLSVAVGYGLFRFALVRYQLRRGYARNPGLQEPIDFRLTDTEIIGRHGTRKFSGKWARVRRATWVGPDWLLLYPTEATCYYLDLRHLQPPATPAHLARLLEQHQIPQRQV